MLKAVLGLSITLLLSLALNYWQHRQAITAPLRDEIAGLESALEDSQELQKSVRESTSRLASAADAASAQLGNATEDYRSAATARPLTHPVCAPGPDRVDAVNRALGATEADE